MPNRINKLLDFIENNSNFKVKKDNKSFFFKRIVFNKKFYLPNAVFVCENQRYKITICYFPEVEKYTSIIEIEENLIYKVDYGDLKFGKPMTLAIADHLVEKFLQMEWLFKFNKKTFIKKIDEKIRTSIFKGIDVELYYETNPVFTEIGNKEERQYSYSNYAKSMYSTIDGEPLNINHSEFYIVSKNVFEIFKGDVNKYLSNIKKDFGSIFDCEFESRGFSKDLDGINYIYWGLQNSKRKDYFLTQINQHTLKHEFFHITDSSPIELPYKGNPIFENVYKDNLLSNINKQAYIDTFEKQTEYLINTLIKYYISEKSRESLNLHPDNPLNDEEIEMVKLISY